MLNSQGIPRVGVYLRVSTVDQSTDLQRAELSQYLQARGWLGSAVFYEDVGISGTKAERPALKEMLKAAQRRQIDIVLVWKLDRLGRSLKHLIVTLEDLKCYDVSFISLRDNIDLSTPSGKLMMHLLAAFAEFEASLIRERVRAGIAHAVAKGKKLGRKKTRNDAEILRLRALGYSFRRIARELGTSDSAVTRALAASKLVQDPKPNTLSLKG